MRRERAIGPSAAPNTVWPYREGLAQAGLVEELFRQFDLHLAGQGYIARGGQILDVSSILQAMKDWRNLRPELFKKQLYCLSRCDR